MEGPYQPRARRSSNPFNRNRSSWTDPHTGVHYALDTATYTSPGFSLHAVSGGSDALFDDFTSPISRRQTAPSFGSLGTGLFGTALSLLGDLTSVSHNGAPSRVSRGRQAEAEEASDQDDEVSHVGKSRRNRPKSMFGRIVDKFAEKGSQPRRQSTRQPAPRQPRTGDLHDRTYDAGPQQPVHPENGGSFVSRGGHQHDEHDRRGERLRQPSRCKSDGANAGLMATIEHAVQYHATEVRRCKKQLERASRQQRVHSGHLQALLDELKSNEAALANAAHDLQAARDNVGRSDPHRRASGQNRPRPEPQPPELRVEDDDMPMPNPGFATFTFGRPRPMHHPFAGFGFNDMDPLADHMFAHHFATFGGMGAHDPFAEFFAVPQGAVPQGAAPSNQRKRTRPAPSSGGIPQAQRPATATYTRPPQQPPRPPPTLLTSEECRRLFQMYSERWAALSNTDPDVPYPARGLHAASLLGRDTLWAPQVSAHPSTWSDETVMQANVQAFFLNVVGLVPTYVEAGASGKVEMGFDRSRATAEQVKQLQDILKRERLKWHSDRLGNRHGGRGGRNEGLQRDVRARAVFHAVCELLETAQ
ncbi:CorA-like Mg2+ transporter protein [Teratosphaeria destructans]|uniref:CorA-like Mg2+ transporter protein n=1 Tax=Teratosphaeria destructans TaxID=418781 RepID=A0A9W7SS02_9PEZI|nr:CorA-like Mg2+ transporter protein [Teratosphaeria destructans]